MFNNYNRSLKRSNFSPTILEPNKWRKFVEYTPTPSPQSYINHDDNEPIVFENDADHIGEHIYGGNGNADVEDNNGSDSITYNKTRTITCMSLNL